MKQHLFEAQYEDQWQALERALSGRALDTHPLPSLYRNTCQHLALARQRQYSPFLQDRLNDLVLRGHQALYGASVARPGALMGFLLHSFPRTVRQQWRLVAFSALLMFGPMIGLTLLVWHRPELALSFMHADQLSNMVQMYDPSAAHWGRARGSNTDVQMFGFYISHNIGIDFQCFGGGLLLGIGTIVFILATSLNGGVVGGYLTAIGYSRTFWPFVVGHSSFELIGAVISGAAGLRMGLALLKPGRYSRVASLRRNAPIAFTLVGGAALMTFCAAFFEAFWSSRVDITPQVKYIVGACLWTGVISWLALGGRWGKGRIDAA